MEKKPVLTDAYEYPPQHHCLRDLRLMLQYEECERCTVRAPIVTEICSNYGEIQAGIIATMVDVLGGALSVRSVYPDWLATASLSLHLFGKATSGMVVATGSVIRAGRTTIVIEVDIHREGGSPAESPERIGLGTMIFSRLPRKEYNIKVEINDSSTEVIDFALDTSGLTRPYLDEIGLRIVDNRAGVIELGSSDYIRNSFGALQGGMFALLTDVAGQQAAEYANGKTLRTVDMEIHYLLQGKVGPFQTRASILRVTQDTVLTRVELIDCGADANPIAAATNLLTSA